MVVRLFQHILQYSDIAIKRAIPLAMALMNVMLDLNEAFES